MYCRLPSLTAIPFSLEGGFLCYLFQNLVPCFGGAGRPGLGSLAADSSSWKCTVWGAFMHRTLSKQYIHNSMWLYFLYSLCALVSSQTLSSDGIFWEAFRTVRLLSVNTAHFLYLNGNGGIENALKQQTFLLTAKAQLSFFQIKYLCSMCTMVWMLFSLPERVWKS